MTTTIALQKLLMIGTVDLYETGSRSKIFIEVEYGNRYNPGKGPRLSIMGTEGPLKSGNAKGSTGQIEDLIADYIGRIKFAPGWTPTMLNRLLEVWRRYHLNDMRSGTPAQMKFVEANAELIKSQPYNERWDFTVKLLTEAGLEPDDGHYYGSAWQRIEVPQDVLDFLAALPDSPEPMPGSWGRA